MIVDDKKKRLSPNFSLSSISNTVPTRYMFFSLYTSSYKNISNFKTISIKKFGALKIISVV
jgi:hypothetical protein